MLFEKVSDRQKLTEEEQKRAGELFEAWKLSEKNPAPRENPLYGTILEEMAARGELASELDRVAAAEIAANAWKTVDAQGTEPVDLGSEAGLAGGGAWSRAPPWLQDFAIVTAFAIAAVLVGLLLGRRRSPGGGDALAGG